MDMLDKAAKPNFDELFDASPDTGEDEAPKEQGSVLITREIGIDMGHRVTNHGSKCRNLHGHRYKIEIGVQGQVQAEGEQNPQEGMLVDFGFLKEEMMNWIDALCDHGMVLWRQDPLVIATLTSVELQLVDDFIKSNGYGAINSQQFWGKIVVVPFVPTAENLCKWWFNLLREPVLRRSNALSELVYVKAWETPNCSAIYSI